MKLIYLIITSLLLQSSDCDNKKVLSNIFWGLDPTKSNSELVSKLKSDARFTNYSKTTEEYDADTKLQSDNFQFSEHSLIKKGGGIKFVPKSNNRNNQIFFVFGFDTDSEANDAYSIMCSELDKGCFDKISWKVGEVVYEDKNVSIKIERTNSDPYISLTVLIEKK